MSAVEVLRVNPVEVSHARERYPPRVSRRRK
jgi:hypothetical protein